VAAVSGATLSAKGFADFTDLPNLTSGISARRNVNGLVDFRIRGLGTGAGNDSYVQSVALFIDGSYSGRGAEYAQPIFDVERVEVIKGTQAALLAKNTSLGAISLTTRKPGDVFDYDLTGNYEFNLKSHRIEGGVDIPITNNLSIRVSAQDEDQGGYVKNLVDGKKYGEVASDIGRIVAVWRPSSTTNATLLYQEWQSHQFGVPVELVVDNLGNALGRATSVGLAGDYSTALNRTLIQSNNTVGDSVSETHGRRVILTVNHDIGDNTLTWESAYSHYNKVAYENLDYYVGSFITTDPLQQGNNQFTQELRFTSPADRRLNFVAGIFGLAENWTYHRTVSSESPGLAANQPGGNPLTGAFYEAFEERTRSISGFAQANLKIIDPVTLSAGGRLTHESTSADFYREALQDGIFSDFLYPPIAPSNRSYDTTSFDPSVSLNYKPVRWALAYASFSRGTKGAGFLSAPSSAATALFLPERADTFEVGVKLGRGRTFFNIDGFHTHIKDYQQTDYNGVAFISDEQTVISKGIEVEGSVELLPHLVLAGSLTYAKARLQSGDPTVDAPDWTGTSSISYSFPVASNLQVDVGGGLDYRSRIYWGTLAQTVGVGNSAANTVDVPSNPDTEFNARIAVGPADGRWQVSLIGRNLSNTTTVSYATPGSLFAGTGFAAPNLPRTVMLQFTIRAR
jgi:iron complex outermembrane receptor protein